MLSNYRTYGESHGTAMFWDCSKPNADAFLAHMETRIPAANYEEYLDGFMAGKLGECRGEWRCMRGLRKEGSE